MDNGLVQLINNHIGNSQGSLAQRWSTQLKKHVKIERPLVVEEYNMLIYISISRIHLRSTKYYMHMFYYCITLAVVNGWLLYRIHCLLRDVSKKSQIKVSIYHSNQISHGWQRTTTTWETLSRETLRLSGKQNKLFSSEADIKCIIIYCEINNLAVLKYNRCKMRFLIIINNN